MSKHGKWYVYKDSLKLIVYRAYIEKENREILVSFKETDPYSIQLKKFRQENGYKTIIINCEITTSDIEWNNPVVQEYINSATKSLTEFLEQGEDLRTELKNKAIKELGQVLDL